MFKKRAIKRYFYNLFPHLKARYGYSCSYTNGQILKTLEELGFSKKYKYYALAIFMEKNDFINLSTEHSVSEMGLIREEIANMFYSGDRNYQFEEPKKRKIGNSGHDSGSDFPHD